MPKHGLLRDITQKASLYKNLLKAQKNKKSVPLIVNLFVTGKCNTVCSYCYVEIEKKTGREFSKDEWKNLINELYIRGTRRFTLVGGEPLIYPHLDEIIEHLYSKNVYFNLTTNGLLLHKHIKAARMASEVMVSLDGDSNSHNSIRGKNSFEQAVRNIDLAIKHGINIRLCAVITKNNFDQIDFLVDFTEKRNIYITFTPLIDAPDIRREKAEDLRLSDEKVKEFFLNLREAKKNSTRIVNSNKNIDYMINYPIKYGKVIWKGDAESGYYKLPCPYGRFLFHITNTGEIYPCPILWNNDYFISKNIFDDGLDETLSHASNNLKCQCCSFANAVDWNSITSFEWLAYGIMMTAKQAFGK